MHHFTVGANNKEMRDKSTKRVRETERERGIERVSMRERDRERERERFIKTVR